MDGMQNWTTYLEAMRNRLLIVNDADSLISVLTDVKNTNRAVNNRRCDGWYRTEHVAFGNLFRGKSGRQGNVPRKR